ncbi:hypothetical protein [Alkaliflexus imshenetskii]|uniref:hypothetical protein n=1 Tax=Alkaliflexus imshenetskii TaxID=286730 RepID=UPI00047BE2C6|nr:hypothetical protein [Alkaliflexus imshenetskii]
MDTGMIIMGVILTLLFITPFIFFRDRDKKAREKKLLTSLNELAAQNNATLSVCDVWNDSAIGIDKETSTLAFVIQSEKRTVNKVVQLVDMQSCRLVSKSHLRAFKHEDIRVTDSVSIVFEHVNRSKPDEVLEFYNDDFDSLTLGEELKVAEKWTEIIKTQLAGLHHQKRA